MIINKKINKSKYMKCLVCCLGYCNRPDKVKKERKISKEDQSKKEEKGVH